MRDVTSGGAWGHIQSSKGIVDELPAQAALLEPESSEEDGWDQIKSVVKREKTDMLIKVSRLSWRQSLVSGMRR